MGGARDRTVLDHHGNSSPSGWLVGGSIRRARACGRGARSVGRWSVAEADLDRRWNRGIDLSRSHDHFAVHRTRPRYPLTVGSRQKSESRCPRTSDDGFWFGTHPGRSPGNPGLRSAMMTCQGCGIALRTASRTSSSLGHGLPVIFASSPPFLEATVWPSTRISNCPCRPFSRFTGSWSRSSISAAKLAALDAVVAHVWQYTIRMAIGASIHGVFEMTLHARLHVDPGGVRLNPQVADADAQDPSFATRALNRGSSRISAKSISFS